jgi:hypothetical protein
MGVKTTYRYLVERSDKRAQELYIRDTGVRASTIWHDRYVSRIPPAQIARDRDLPVAAVYEALAYCQDHWDVICQDKDREQEWLERRSFFAGPPADPPADPT